MQEETEEEFLERYALAAAAAGESIEVVEEGDLDEETQDIELGKFFELFHRYIFLPKLGWFHDHIFVSLEQMQVLWMKWTYNKWSFL